MSLAVATPPPPPRRNAQPSFTSERRHELFFLVGGVGGVPLYGSFSLYERIRYDGAHMALVLLVSLKSLLLINLPLCGK